MRTARDTGLAAAGEGRGRASRPPTIPGRADRLLEHHGFVTHYWDQGEGDPLVLLHGLADACLAFHPVLDGLASQYRCLVPDLPGFGFTSRPRRITPQLYVDWLVGFLDALGLERVAVVGHSLGGLLGILLARAHPQRVARLSLVASAGLGRRLPGLLRMMSLPLVPRLIYRPTLAAARESLRVLVADPRVVTDEIVEWSWQYNGSRPEFARHMADVTRLAGPLLFGMPRRYVFVDRLHEIAAPLQLVWGDRDPLFPVAHARAAAARRPDAALVVLDHVAHIPMLERPAAFVEAIERFHSSAVG